MKYLFALPLTLALLAGCFGAFPVQPGVPTNLQASEDQGDAINLTWIAVPAAGAYLIYRDGAAAAYATSQIAAYRDTDVEAERQYSYRVSALDIYGQLESAQSDSDIGSTYGFSWQAAQSLASGVLTYSAAAGGGFALALASDIRIATKSARMSLPACICALMSNPPIHVIPSSALPVRALLGIAQ